MKNVMIKSILTDPYFLEELNVIVNEVVAEEKAKIDAEYLLLKLAHVTDLLVSWKNRHLLKKRF